MDMGSLFAEAFLDGEAERATAAIEQARARVSDEGKVDAFSFEVLVPDEPDAGWLRDRVLRPIVYFCQSTGAALPACPGVFVTFFQRDRMYCVLAAEVIAWATKQLGVTTQGLIDAYGPSEREPAVPRTPA